MDWKHLRGYVVHWGTSVALLLAAVSCSAESEYRLRPTGPIPAASGTVSISENNLGSITLDVSAENLDTSEAVREGDYLVVWARRDVGVERLGVMTRTEDGAQLIATTASAPFTLVVTVEAAPDLSEPVNVPVLTSRYIALEP